MSGIRLGRFPGSFDPATVAHLGIADAAAEQCGLSVVEFVLSEATLGKDHADRPGVDERAAELAGLVDHRRDRLVRVTADQLLVDIARGCDVLVMGADKWAQINEARWYGSTAARDAAIAALPVVALVPRPPVPLPRASDRIVLLDLPPWMGDVSSTAVRSGRHEWRAR